MAKVVEMEFSAREGEPGKARRPAQARLRFATHTRANLAPDMRDIVDEFAPGHDARRVLVLDIRSAAGMEACVLPPRRLRHDRVNVRAVERVVGDMPERVLADPCGPLSRGARAHALLKHCQRRDELAEHDSLVVGEVHARTLAY